MSDEVTFSADLLRRYATDLFTAAGLSAQAAGRVSDALIEADLSGRGSHGMLQADRYIERLIAGAMSIADAPQVVSRSHGAIVLDADGMEGHLVAEDAMMLAIETARETGIAAVAVRRAQHMGVVGRYVRMAAEAGCVGIAMGNTKPVMAAPGGVEKLVGTNPLAIGIPATREAVVLDMATSAGTYGRIRQANALGLDIPAGWALDADGVATTDPAEAMKGLLLPVGGAKGFALSFMIDLLAGLLSGGAWGTKLGLIDDSTVGPQMSSYLFIVLDIASFRPLEEFKAEADEAIAGVRQSRRAEGVDRLYTPGERSAEQLAASKGAIRLAPAVVKALAERGRQLGITVPAEFLE
ncbi:MAG: lactate dehydrogenase [Martelella sp.]|uniref:Ldh family oxidoreductase n=1 Tax=unclassified Martelella TaxID=2629616 RepID=UPI000C3D96B3|nr:Ldh family oxidoreductase [Martelella sp.]MAU22378.1 lactate dehydrogenase [Martelella sp.]